MQTDKNASSDTKNQNTKMNRWRSFPKVELHRHLECSMRFSTLLELARAGGMALPTDEAAAKKQLLITEPMADLDTVLKKFLASQEVLRSAEILTRITFEAIEDAHREGIRILELRYAPTYIRMGHDHLTFDRSFAAIRKGIDQARHLPVAVGLILTIQRILPLSDARDVTDFALSHRGDILAIDLADSEVGFDAAPFAPLFARALAGGLHVTVHSGEADYPESAESVRVAIERLGAQRIGHGLQIARSPEVVEFVRASQVPLELCPTSNRLTNAVPSIGAHPFRSLMNEGVLVTLNSDDPGVFDIDLTHEYVELDQHLAFTAAEFDRINDIAAAASFLPLAAKQLHWPRPIVPRLAPLSS